MSWVNVSVRVQGSLQSDSMMPMARFMYVAIAVGVRKVSWEVARLVLVVAHRGRKAVLKCLAKVSRVKFWSQSP